MNHPLLVNFSPKNVKETADELEALLQSKSIQVFSRINHGEAARASGLTLQDEEVVIFGDPKVGTYLMQECPALGIDLPLKIVVWQDEQTCIGYRDPIMLLADYKIVKHIDIVEKMSALMARLVQEVITNLSGREK